MQYVNHSSGKYCHLPDSNYSQISRFYIPERECPVFDCVFLKPAYEERGLDAFARITQSAGSLTGI